MATLVLLLSLFRPAVVQPGQPAATGRILATVTTLEGTVHMSGVLLELRTSSDPTVLAKTMTDGAGVVTFPDVPPGRYIIQATRPGFVSSDSAVFDVRAGDVAQVLIDIRLTFVMPKLTAVQDRDGRISDVTISYPLDLTAQMLEYAGVKR